MGGRTGGGCNRQKGTLGGVEKGRGPQGPMRGAAWGQRADRPVLPSRLPTESRVDAEQLGDSQDAEMSGGGSPPGAEQAEFLEDSQLPDEQLLGASDLEQRATPHKKKKKSRGCLLAIHHLRCA